MTLGNGNGRYATWGVFLFALAVALLRIQVRSLWFDEIFMVDLVGRPWGEFWKIIMQREFNMVLYAAMLKGWAPVAEGSDVLFRLPSALFFAVSTSLIYSIARQFMSHGYALLCVALFVLNPFLLRYAQEVRSYSLFLMLSLSSTRCFINYVQDGGRRMLAGYVTASVLAVYAHFFGMFLIAAQGGAYLLVWRLRGGFGRFVLTYCLIVLLLLPCFWFALFNGGNIGWIAPPSFRAIYDLLYQFFPYGTFLPLLLCGLLLLQIGKTVFEAMGSSVDRQFRLSCLFLFCLALPVGLVFVLSFKKPMFMDRYFIFCLPYFLLLSVRTLEAVPVRAAVGTACLLVLLSGVASARYLEAIASIGEDWKGTAAFLATECGSDDAVLVLPYSGELSLRYYLAKNEAGQRLNILSVAAMPEEGRERRIREIAQAASNVWVVVRHPYEKSPLVQQIDGILSRLNRKAEVHDKHAVSISVWPPAGAGHQ